MSIEKRAFFIAGGESLAMCEEWQRTANAGLAAANAWAKEIGATDISYHPRNGLTGMQFEGVRAPKGWVKHQGWGNDWYQCTDSRKSVEGKSIRKRIASMAPSEIKGESHFGSSGDGLALFRARVENIGGVWIITQHKECKSMPPDSRRIKGSEYLAMKEAAEERR